jgi:hypothetical protein
LRRYRSVTYTWRRLRHARTQGARACSPNAPPIPPNGGAFACTVQPSRPPHASHTGINPYDRGGHP